MLCSLTKSSPLAFSFPRDQYIVQYAAEVQRVLVLEIPLSLATMGDPLQKYCFRYASKNEQCPPNVHVLSFCVIVVTCCCRTATPGLVSVEQQLYMLCP
jgi:hypothetical protein